MKTLFFTLSLIASTSAFASSDDSICDRLENKLNKISAEMTNCESTTNKCSEAEMNALNAKLGRIYDKMLANGCAEEPSNKSLKN